MAATTYTVVWGDTLSDLAVRFNTTVDNLVKWNNIQDPNFIVVGQVLIVSPDQGGGGTTPTPSKNTTSRATITVFGLQSNTDRTIYATWSWDKSNTENYQAKWTYDTGDGVWFIGSDSTVDEKQATYNAPSNALRVRFTVKPISKTHTVNDTEVSYWTAGWSTEKTYDFKDNPPEEPSTPTVEIDGYKLTAELDNLDLNATSIQFQIVRDDSTVFNTGTATIIMNHVSYSCTVSAGGKYKVRCRAYRDGKYSDWSDYSSNVNTIPETPSGFTTYRASSETSVYLAWPSATAATGYEIEYTTEKNYFDGSNQTTSISGIEFTHYEITGLESGDEYFFRVRATNEQGESGWSGIVSVVIGEPPAAPTTWSSTTTAIVGEPLTLYWVHNAEDGSNQTYAELELYIGGNKEPHTIQNPDPEDEENNTSSFSVDTSSYVEGTKIEWRVRTAGVTNEYGEWSIQRSVDIYAPATLELTVTDNSGETFELLESFPFYISALAGPKTQSPVGYYLTIKSNATYQTVDNIGNNSFINAGDLVYSKYFDTNDALLVEMSAGNINLENNVEYTVSCIVSMNSGLTAEAAFDFKVAWTDDEYEPNAEIGINYENVSASIRPYCLNEDEEPVENITLSVYRREFDGTFTELATGIDNTSNTYITDPHPSLDFARYRIVAISNVTGAISFYDVPGVPVQEKAVIIQWDEAWTYFDVYSSDVTVEPAWSGSLLKLPYNIDVSDTNQPDVSLVEYIGRAYPIAYYGTQLGTSSSWSVAIPKTDKETLYALRRLAIWMGNVYVREPSGSGYWANIKVSFSQTHLELTIPVSLEITRVEGGA